MKTFRIILVLCITAFYSTLSCVAQLAANNIQVSYIGSTGYLLETAHKKVLVDPTYGDIVQKFGYPYASKETERKLLNAEVPFDNIDLILISHVHLGHFDAHKTYQCLKANSNATLLTTQGVADSIASVADDLNSVVERIVVPNIEFYSVLDTLIDGIAIRTTKVNHWGPSELLQFSFSIDGLELAYYLDYNKRAGQKHHVKTTDIDLAILDGALMLDDAKRLMFKNDFKAAYSIFTHFTNRAEMEAKLSENKVQFINVSYMSVSMEKQLFVFSDLSVQDNGK